MQYPSIRIEGSILSSDIIDAIERGEKGFQKAKDFGLEPTSKVKDEIANAWADARDQWRIYRRKIDALKPDATGTTETRNLFLVPLLSVLGYQAELARKGEEVNGRNYAISHRDTSRDGFPIHVVGCNDSLDKRRTEGGSRMSPHALVQEYLNLTEHLYAVVSNGRLLRLLRDSTRLVKMSFLEFDLDRIFEEELFADFAILFRLMHASRMPRTQDSSVESTIEIYHQDALDSGSRIREGLSEAVEKSIRELANGFLNHPENSALRESIESGETKEKEYYQWQLRLIYRLLFLMVIEERDLVFPPDAVPRHRGIYYDYYSIGRIRQLSEQRHFADRNYQDAWAGLRNTFRLFEEEKYGTKLSVAPLAGDIFDDRAIGLLGECQLDNEVLLTCLRNLSLFRNPITGQMMRVNYSALNVEEFGSVYEGLLEYDPQIQRANGHWEFSFVAGDDRAASGSHYTPDELVQPLIKHSLDYIIADKLKEPEPEQALLSITVCDVACGSGHILLNAARRIATELAILRTGEDQPSPSSFRAAVRDVIRNCIYGVDLNPLAVELCKVSLWLEAHVPGEPLNFLDHHIKCGNAIVGLASRDELKRGIPDEAFKTLGGDDKAIATEFRKRNKEERRGYQSLDFSGRPAEDLNALRSNFSSVSNLPENTPGEIRQKQEAYDEFQRGIHLRNLKALADIQVAQFYIPKTPEMRRKVTTHDQYRRYLRGENPHPEPTGHAQATALRKRFFHWFLEFPDVFAHGGFDCILGNPPYLGGTFLSGRYGHRFCEWVKYEFQPTGLSDLIVYFIRRFYTLIKPERFASFIATNSITDGDVRKDGLEQVIASGRNINFAVDSVKWPGRANVFVSLIAYVNGDWKADRFLDGRSVTYISPFLEDYEEIGAPIKLKANAGRLYQGVDYLGEGFMLKPGEANEILASRPDYCDVIFPALKGQELNNSPSQQPGRFIINFFDWPESKARGYNLPFEIVESRAKPERMEQKDAGAKKKWWLLLRPRMEMHGKLLKLERCLVTAVTTKHMSFAMLPTNAVFLKTLKVLIFDDFCHFALLQSSIHEVWARKYSGALKRDLRYSNCFEIFAFPNATEHFLGLATIGESYHEKRRQLMLQMQLGLTKTYNLFHHPKLNAEVLGKASQQKAKVATESYASLLQLRELHCELDESVLAAYGWHEPTDEGQPIDLQHDFYEVDYLPENDRVRYTIHPDARREILKRLVLLNHRRHAEEVVAGLHEKKKKPAKKQKAAKEKSAATLFDTE